MKRKIIFKLFKIGVVAAILLVAIIWVSNTYVINYSRKYISNKINDLPTKKVGLLLGTKKILASGNVNQYYQYRVEATVALYKAGKIESVLISGDNGRQEYNEPETLMADLIAAGIPANKIYLDFAGFRTYDSVVRAHAIFGQTEFIVISQEFHNQRAVYIARKKGLNAYGFNAKAVGSSYGFKTMQREKLAKTKAVLDIWMNKKPHFLGDTIKIN